MGELGLCTFNDVISAVGRQLATDIPADFGLPIFLIRLLHNKLLFFLFFFLRCYSLYFDALQANRFLSPLLLPFIFFAVGQKRWRRLIIISLLLFPLFLIFNPLRFNLGVRIYVYVIFFIILSFFGWIKFFLMLYFRNKRNKAS